MNPHHDWNKLKAVVANKKRQDKMFNVLEKIPLGLNMIYSLLLNAIKRRMVSWPGGSHY